MKLDPITLAVLRAGLINAVAEMKAVVVQTAYSNLWKEAGDLSCGLLTAKGELAVQGPGDIPIHLASMPMSLLGCFDTIPPETLKPGDVLLQNDPYRGNTHLPDLMMAKPIFHGERLIAFAAVRGHYVDIGGGGPGSYSAAMPDIIAEGLRLPPLLIFKEGRINDDVVAIMAHNMRNPRERLGDLRSQYSGCLAVERRVMAYCEKYGVDAVVQSMQEIIRASEILTRQAIQAIPDGDYAFEDWCDGDGITEEPIRINVTLTVRDDQIVVDFDGSSPQTRGGMNAPLATTLSAVCYAVKCVTDPENLANSGSYRPIELRAPRGSVVNPVEPAPVVAGNHETASRIVDAIIGALATAVPHRVCAAGSGTSAVLSLGATLSLDGQTRQLLMVEAHGSGQGANANADGVNARRVNIGNTGNTPSEALERSFPITVLGYGISRDGGGAGRMRGGTGIYRTIRLDHEATVTLTAERAAFGPYGLHGGVAAPTSKYWVEVPGEKRRSITSKTAPMRLPKGTLIHVQPSGGGGYGSPAERALDAIQDDLDDGYISCEAAEEIYGVCVNQVMDRAEGRHLVTGRRSQA